MKKYPFFLIQHEREGQIKNNKILASRPFSQTDRSFEADARKFVPGRQLETAVNTAIAVGEPLLITGQPGTGKTQSAFYAAYKLGIEPVIHFQVKSDSTAKDLLYHFDTVRYFHDAHLLNIDKSKYRKSSDTLDKKKYVEPRALWKAFEKGKETNLPQVVLIDEIDKAPRDFPNDLLHELDKMEFMVTETQEKISAPGNLRPLVFITSNSERRLPEPFLRRCVYHHIVFDDRIVEQAVFARREEFTNLSEDFLKLAIKRFLNLRDRNLRKQPATGELLVWLKVLALAVGQYDKDLESDLSQLPYLGVLLKDHQDIEELVTSPRFRV
ncbi:MoxR family ATPase [Desulfobacterales bacterium HSG16]|nr:MoxR family ATPase [Desulfobacterales bacterium HSG16]